MSDTLTANGLVFGAHYAPDGNTWIEPADDPANKWGGNSYGVEFTKLDDGGIKIDVGWQHESSPYTLTPDQLAQLKEWLTK